VGGPRQRGLGERAPGTPEVCRSERRKQAVSYPEHKLVVVVVILVVKLALELALHLLPPK